MARLHIGKPLWLEPDPFVHYEVPRYAALHGARSADAVIVGGGFTGATIAWHFANAGVRVVVLEAERIGRGSTGASTALLMQEPDNDIVELTQMYGQRRARRVWELCRSATRDCVNAVSRLGIACG